MNWTVMMMPPSAKDIDVLRELAKRTMEVAGQAIQDSRRELWSDFNSLRTHAVPVYVLDPQGMWREVFAAKDLKCEHSLFRRYENWLRLQLYHASLGDDFITEPWITVTPDFSNSNEDWRSWGVKIPMDEIKETMAFHLTEPPISKPEDLAKLVAPFGIVDQEATDRTLTLLSEAVGDIISVIPDYYPQGRCSVANTLAYLLGPEQVLYQLYDQPEMVHELSRLISDTARRVFDAAERQDWLTNCNHTFLGNAEIQAMAYSRELPVPGPLRITNMKQHWIYDHAQDFECVGPDMFHDFVLRYEMPLYAKFGLVAYGCCENLTRKIRYLKQIPNLRRVAVTPWADLEECARQLGEQYVISWRPNPAEMVTTGFDVGRIKAIVKRAKRSFEAHHCHWEVNLKDFITVEHDASRLKNWVRVVREALNEQAA